MFQCSSLHYIKTINTNVSGTSPKYARNTREIIYSLNPYTLLMPASNVKLFTTSSALAILGPDYRYKTSLYIDGTIKDGILDGNLIIRGSGDPSISGRHNDGNQLEMFQNWADTLSSIGIRKINGTIIGDDNIFDDIGLGYSWGWDDLSYYYAAQIGGLCFNDNCVDLFIIPNDSIGGKPQILTKPPMNYMEIINEISTVSADSSTYIDFYRKPGAEVVIIFGTIKADVDTVKEWVTVENPTNYTLSAFKYTLENNGITANTISDIDELPIKDLDYDSYRFIATHESIPLLEIIKTINKVSQNFYAEQLQKTLGVELKEVGSSKKGIEAEKDWLSSLRAIHNHSDYKVFFDSLPIGGVDGTLKNRLKGSNAVGHIFAKTGYVGRVRALSGYVHAANGREYIFSILVNHYPVPTGRINDLQDHIVTLLYNLDY
jgi:D-alanyl-D-alanine carboxypeptidase/D-alanyl-D-alanine-endopeptidase (penicillin-binding protein 4)